MSFLSKDVQIAVRAAKTQIMLFELQRMYSDGEGFNIDCYTAIERALDDIIALANGTKNTKTYPNPCAEILLPCKSGNYY